MGKQTYRPRYETLREVWHESASVGRRLLDYVRAYQAVRGFSPTVREIALALGTSTGHLTYWLNRLERDGSIRRPYRGTSRCIELCDAPLDRQKEETDVRRIWSVSEAIHDG